MYIDRIELKNLRGFERLDFSLARAKGQYAGWTVFTGDNGSGKSTLLRAIAIAVAGKDAARALQPSFKGWVREGCDEATIQLQVARVPGDDTLAEVGRAPAGLFPAKVVLRDAGRETLVDSVVPEGKPKNYATPERSLWAAEAQGWFACGYGPFRRVFGASPDAMRQMVAPATERFVTMFQEAASLAEVNQWLRDLSHKALERRHEAEEQLELLLEMLRDDLMPNQITIDRVDSDGLWLKDRNGLRLAWTEMSDGYRSALALLADILRHLIKAYGVAGLAERGADGKISIRRSGLVLIDEIDAHLHPEWQREIGFWLRRHFPNVQFLVTTHSPIICQAADRNGIFVLPEPGSGGGARALTSEEYEKIIAGKSDSILLTAAFGLRNTRSPRAVKARADYAALRAKQRSGATMSSDEREKMRQLELFALVDEE